MDTNKHESGGSSEERRLTTRDEVTDFLLYTAPDGVVKVECILHAETIWLPQKRIAELFDVGVPVISKHLANIFESGELLENSVISILETTAADGKNYKTKFYNLDAIISLALLPGSELVILEQSDWSEERNINPYAVFEKPPAMLQVTPNIGRRGQTGIAVTGINFTPDRSGIVLRCDGRVMASNLDSDDAGRVTASFTVPTEARNGKRIVEMADSTPPGPAQRHHLCRKGDRAVGNQSWR